MLLLESCTIHPPETGPATSVTWSRCGLGPRADVGVWQGASPVLSSAGASADAVGARTVKDCPCADVEAACPVPVQMQSRQPDRPQIEIGVPGCGQVDPTD